MSIDIKVKTLKARIFFFKSEITSVDKSRILHEMKIAKNATEVPAYPEV